MRKTLGALTGYAVIAALVFGVDLWPAPGLSHLDNASVRVGSTTVAIRGLPDVTVAVIAGSGLLIIAAATRAVRGSARVLRRRVKVSPAPAPN